MNTKNDISHYRNNFLNWVRKSLIGPGYDVKEESEEYQLTSTQPIERYHAGILFPIVPGDSGIDPASEESDDNDDNSAFDVLADNKIQAEPAIRSRRYVPPSSVGFSFFITGTDIRIQVSPWGIHYVQTESERDAEGKFIPRKWARTPLGDRDNETLNLAAPTLRHPKEDRTPVYNNKGEIHILWRPYADGWITTVTFCNKQALIENTSAHAFVQARNRDSFFETELSCVIDSGEIGIYPRVDRTLLTEEEKELELQYRDNRIYAIGHGAAVDWISNGDHVTEIKTNFFPAVEVPQVTADVVKNATRTLELAYLADFNEASDEISNMLENFVTDYSLWIAEQNDIAETFEPDEIDTAHRITSKMTTAVKRMKLGIQVLKNDKIAAKAFGLANRAMLLQMEKYDQCLGKGKRTYRWRLFQLAFLLLAIESVVNEDSDHRDLVDLIWFPTGGGKTEAYLGLIAFLVILRRLKFPSSSGGTSVLMRYTLRLLTAQQFERATRLICSLELIRRNEPNLLGVEPISIGMWVGEASSPNTYRNALELVKRAVNGTDEPPLSLIIGSCPWCHTPFKASENYIATEHTFKFRCTNPACEFGQVDKGFIPCNVVDEALFESPPTLLIATVDKFARLAWDVRTAAFFGRNGNRPPELIIQDELHLIAGALGSIAALYEAALDTVLTQRGVRPKYIASTATIRMADQQVQRLYGRELKIFPPPGISYDDSFFARTVPINERPGRLYVGYLAPIKRRQECMAPLAAALLAAPENVFPEGHVERDSLLEAWWTQVVYHGSLKGVGNSHNSFVIEVPSYYSRLRVNSERIELSNRQPEKKSRRRPELAQLTSISSPAENKKTFDRLEKSRDEPECLDAVLATNMISVGLDVPRLALMIINGQPLTTAEYIQASSRVGRSDVPGLVFVNYYRDQARSLSHYEDFRPYHESFYRFVEPTSITPFTYQARMRALHAALTIVVRHTCSHLQSNSSAGCFDPSHSAVADAVRRLKIRCSFGDPERSSETKEHIDFLVTEWKNYSDRCRFEKRQLNYSVKDSDKASERLLYNFDDNIKGLWPTLQSMRNVENSALMRLL